MRKAFSLFTPLIGTTVIIIAIIVSATMMENDQRLSRGLISSYEQTNQNLAAKMIRAASEVKILENIESLLDKKLTGGLSIVCRGCSAGTVKNNFESIYFTGYTLNSIQNELRYGNDGVYSGIVTNINLATEYTPSNRQCAVAGGDECNDANIGSDEEVIARRFDCCLSKAIALDPSTAVSQASFGTDGRLAIELLSAGFSSDAFSVQFENKQNANDKLTLSIAPHNFKYYSKYAIDADFDAIANAYEEYQRLPVLDDTNRTKICLNMKTNPNYVSASLYDSATLPGELGIVATFSADGGQMQLTVMSDGSATNYLDSC